MSKVFCKPCHCRGFHSCGELGQGDRVGHLNKSVPGALWVKLMDIKAHQGIPLGFTMRTWAYSLRQNWVNHYEFLLPLDRELDELFGHYCSVRTLHQSASIDEETDIVPISWRNHIAVIMGLPRREYPHQLASFMYWRGYWGDYGHIDLFILWSIWGSLVQAFLFSGPVVRGIIMTHPFCWWFDLKKSLQSDGTVDIHHMRRTLTHTNLRR